MELTLLSTEAEEIFELINMVVAVVAGLGGLVLLLSIKGEMGKIWRGIAGGIVVFAVAELVGGLEILTGAEDLLGVSVETWYVGLQTVFLLLVLSGVAFQDRMFNQLRKAA